MKEKTKDFWGDSKELDNHKGSDNHSSTKPAPALSNKELDKERLAVNKPEFSWWWLMGGLALILLIVGAVIINQNHGHLGDNATNISGTINIDNGDTKINWNRYETFEVELSSTYTITTSGTYHLTGSITDGLIMIDTPAEAEVRLILDNVTIKNSSGPAIACLNGEDLVIELVGKNILEDAASYSSDWNDDIDGVIYSKADLSFTGDGELDIKANYADAIVGKDDLTFRSGSYLIDAADDGIRGKDSVHIENGSYNIVASADAVKATNETDTTKGFVLVENGNIQAKAGAKGLKAINSILIYGGNFTINSVDDAIHSNNYVGVTDGEILISSGDDGIHADARLIIDGGTINITNSYEGIEAQKISINSGKISIMSNDDGLNAGGGADASATNRVGAGAFDTDENCELAINGGELYVNAAGDGIDSNGWLYFNGGTVVVDGPTNNGNGSLDSGSGIMMNGGKVITVGASGMAETLGSASSINNVSIFFTSTLSKGTKVEIKNANGESIISHTSAKTFSHMSAGTAEFKHGDTYIIYVDDTKYDEFTISGVTTVVGNANGAFQNMNKAGAGQNVTNNTNGDKRQ